MTVRKDVTIYRGNSVKLTIAVTGVDGASFASNADLQWGLRQTPAGVVLAQKSVAGGGITVVAGGVEIDLATTDTDFDPGVYYHEMRVQAVADVYTALIGAFIIKRTASHA